MSAFDLHAMTEQLAELVSVETPSADLDACRRGADAVSQIGASILGIGPERVDVEGRPHLRWGSLGAAVVLIGHFDTVWPLGTIDRWPFSIDDGVATGPGCFDMKAGVVQSFHAVAASGVDDWAIVLTSDEEIGSLSSRTLVEQTAADARAVLVMEPSGDGGALKIGRKGVGAYRLSFTGRAAHAGLEPEKGISALLALADAAPRVAALSDLGAGTTVTPTLAESGTAMNVVPAHASLVADVRTLTIPEEQRVRSGLHGLESLDGVTLEVVELTGRPPFPESAAAELYALASEVATSIGIDTPPSISVGGGSDGNFTAALGIATLDGLGAVGGGAHAEGEHVVLRALPERTALVSELIRRLA